ncbi:LysR family transcriptional regulator [Salinibacterium sp. SWN1162]|uniref:LysR family transcriptional regulator n=1 Tax=Salinibacterium sp. SWN1162 TaxID=2792053 RepID=UPI0018CD93C0|nr:LysR substrate-binding domain-containing protein [Salinibacterium sp. SWN1162]MBH0008277.1 LysR family transcriptional regulator [Salinibacterium sp. SWN1162]
MELRQLRYFLAVADELHFGRAAERLHMSQPPLSVQVSRLEEELGTTLFERSTRSVRLTPAGVHLQASARSIMSSVNTVQDEMREYAEGLSGRVTVGFVSSANYTVLPGVVQLFRARRPHVTLDLRPLTSGEQIAGLLAGTLDVAIVRDELPTSTDPSTELITEVVFEELLVACLPADHPLSHRSEVSADEIVEIPMVTYPRALMPGYVDRVSAVFNAAAGVINVVEEVVHQETALGFVAAGVGTSILPESVRHLLPPSIVAIPLTGSPTSRLIAVRAARHDDKVAGAFVECLHDAAQALVRR